MVAIAQTGTNTTTFPRSRTHGSKKTHIPRFSTSDEDPFGRLLQSTGTYADANKFRFSTKYFEDDWGLSYYGYRYYQADTGRWPNRDPVGERGGINLYGFVGNDPIRLQDALGRLTLGSTVGVALEAVQDALLEADRLTQIRPIPPEMLKKEALFTYKCAELAFRKFGPFGKPETEAKLAKFEGIDCGKKCKPCQIKFWYWTYLFGARAEDSQGRMHREPTRSKTTGKVIRDFHVVGGKVGCGTGADLPNCFSKQGSGGQVEGPDYCRNFKPKRELKMIEGDVKYYLDRWDFAPTKCYCADEKDI